MRMEKGVLVQARTALGLTQADLGACIGKPRNTITRWENGFLIGDPLLLALALEGLAARRGVPLDVLSQLEDGDAPEGEHPRLRLVGAD